MKQGAHSAYRQRLRECFVELINDQAIWFDPVAFLVVEQSSQQFVGSWAVGDRGCGNTKNHVCVVVLRLVTDGVIPRHAVSVGVGFRLDGGPHATIDGVNEVAIHALDGMVGVATCARQTHQNTQRKDVCHSRGDSKVNASGRVRFALIGQVREARRHNRPFCFGD
ncbi:Uncharacterised protein [Chlamydia trachomatis]|nr:Uncharacterised protein [Chlamydia trachomatis]